MGFIILCAVIFVISLVVIRFKLADKIDSCFLEILSWFGSIVGGTILVICGCICMTIQNDWEYCEAKYYNLKQQIEYVDKDDIVTSENLRNQVLEMNNEIDAHRIYSKNIWFGYFYSERIGNLPKLEWKSK